MCNKMNGKNILAKSANLSLTFYRFSSTPQTILVLFIFPDVLDVLVNLAFKIHNITSITPMNSCTRFLKFTAECKFLLILKVGVPVFICAPWIQYTE